MWCVIYYVIICAQEKKISKTPRSQHTPGRASATDNEIHGYDDDAASDEDDCEKSTKVNRERGEGKVVVVLSK